jgi:opacity protein-like surface antigen
MGIRRACKGRERAVRKLLVVAVAAILLFGLGSVDSARAWNWDLGVRGGIAEGTGDFGDATKTAFAWNIFLEYDFNPRLSLLARYGRHVHGISSDFQRFAGLVAPSPLDRDNLIGDFSVNELAGLLKYSLPLSPKWRIYAQGGAGYYIWNLDLAFDTSEGSISTPGADGSDFGLNGGGGLEYVINPEVSVTVDADYTYIYGDFANGFAGLYAGFVFHFGKDLYK